MMDRNTITALLLITLVLIVTPYYIKLVSPDVDPIEETFNNSTETTAVSYTHLTLPTTD